MGVRALPESEFRELPTSVRMVLVDVFENRDTTIGQIVERTGFPQSHVSASVARLRDNGILMTWADPTDGRRTLVAPSAAEITKVDNAHHTLDPIDDHVRTLLLDRFGSAGESKLTEALAALDLLGRLFVSSAQREQSC